MWPAWEILKETIDREPVSITEDVNMTLVEDGELRKSLCIEKRYGAVSYTHLDVYKRQPYIGSPSGKSPTPGSCRVQ